VAVLPGRIKNLNLNKTKSENFTKFGSPNLSSPIGVTTAVFYGIKCDERHESQMGLVATQRRAKHGISYRAGVVV
jgi:hypothetical protein